MKITKQTKTKKQNLKIKEVFNKWYDENYKWYDENYILYSHLSIKLVYSIWLNGFISGLDYGDLF